MLRATLFYTLKGSIKFSLLHYKTGKGTAPVRNHALECLVDQA